uniref:NAD-dependent epimerase/dehydratase domain-containing protein n=1 Tax=Ananas comosus var. bracteatus TaxID=296719 RepID=A0A6V7NTK5_ANACO|nr:unnamed protein product [Ananas comosus var. bracteatus]
MPVIYCAIDICLFGSAVVDQIVKRLFATTLSRRRLGVGRDPSPVISHCRPHSRLPTPHLPSPRSLHISACCPHFCCCGTPHCLIAALPSLPSLRDQNTKNLRFDWERKKERKKERKMSGVGKLVCVTGASGYIASWLVKLLLRRGYTVRASVRDPSDPKKTEHLRALDGASERLHLFKANLLEEGSFDSIVEGCEGVFHTASPFYHNVTDPKAELIDPALKGTLNVLASCTKASSIRRVVVTSSMAAVMYNERPRTPEVVVDETWFSDAQFAEKSKSWYVLSKALAEEAAWKVAKENSIDMVTINPAMVIGPLLQPTLNTSCEAILKLIDGSSTTYPNYSFGWINVKDVAMAHILAYEVPSANGRYCLVERVAHYSEIVKIIHELYPSLKLPEKCADDKPFAPIYQVSRDKAKSLGIEYIPLETSIKETIESLKEKGFVSF